MSTDSYVHFQKAAPEGAPLLFLFHGTGGDETQFVTLGARLVPEAGIVSPRGDVSEFGANRFFRRTAEGVYDMADLARATEKMAGFVKAHVEAAKPAAVLGRGLINFSTTFLWRRALRQRGSFRGACHTGLRCLETA